MQKVSSTKDCYKENIHLKSSFQFTLNRKLEMSLGNNDQKKNASNFKLKENNVFENS